MCSCALCTCALYSKAVSYLQNDCSLFSGLKYKSLEKKKPVKVKSNKFFKAKSYKVIEADLLHESDWVRHSYDKIAKVIENIVKK